MSIRNFLRTTLRAAAFVAALAVAFPHRNVRASDAAKSEPVEKPSQPLPFEPSEQLLYEGEFSKLLLRGIKIAEFRFTAAPANADAAQKPSDGKDAARQLLFVGDVVSAGWFHKLFGINFHFRVESLVEREGLAVLRTVMLDEQGKRARRSETTYDRAGKVIRWTQVDPNDPESKPRVIHTEFGGAVHDILSAVYHLRTRPLAPGQSFEIPLSDSGRVYRVPATVFAEKKAQKSVLGRVRVVRIEVGLFGKDRPVEGEGKMTMWITDDARRIPVRARMSTDIGLLDIKLKKVSNSPAGAKAK